MKWKFNADESRGNAMTIRYEKHWKPVKENMMKHQSLARAAEISDSTVTKLVKNDDRM